MADTTESPEQLRAELATLRRRTAELEEQHRQMAEELRLAEDRYRLVTKYCADLVAVLSPQGTYRSVGPACYHLLGYQPEELLGLDVFSLCHPDDLIAARQSFSTVLQRSAPHQLTHRVRHRDGSYVLVETMWSVPRAEENGELQEIVAISRPVAHGEREGRAQSLPPDRASMTNSPIPPLDALINSLQEPFFVKDEQHRWVMLNDAACQAMGYPREYLLGRSDPDLHTQEQVNVFWARDDYVLQHGRDINEEEITWQGQRRIISTTKSVYQDAATGKRYIVGTIRDITEHKQAEEALRQSKVFTQAVLDSLTAHIAVLDREGIIIAVNEAWRRFAQENGATFVRHTDVGADYLEVCRRAKGEFADEAQIALAGIQSVLDGTENYFALEYPCHSPTEKRWFLMHVAPLSIEQGGAVVAHLDITERMQVEVELKNKSQLLASLLENLPVSVLRIDGDGVFTEASGAALRAVGLQKQDTLGQNAFRLFPEAAQQIRTALAGGNAHFSITLEHEGKPIHFDTWVFFDAANGSGAVGFAIDVSERRRAEEEVLKLNAELDRRVADRTRDLAVLYDVTAVASESLDLDTTLTHVLKRVSSAMRSKMNTIHLLDTGGERLRLVAHQDVLPVTDAEIDSRPLHDLVEKVVAQGRPLAVGLAGDPGTADWARRNDFATYVGAPMRARGQTRGVLSSFRGRDPQFSVEEVALLSAIADQVGTAVENIRLFEQTRRRMQELDALSRADRELHRHLHLDQVLQTLMDVAVEIGGANKSVLLVWDEQQQVLSAQAMRNLSGPRMDTITFAPGEGIAGQVMVTGEPILVEDVDTDSDVALRHMLAAENIHSFMSIPIKIGQHVFGVFDALYTRQRTFSQEERQFFTALARRAALAIANARLYERAQQVAALEERQRLARELHDSATQLLYGLTLHAETGRQLAEAGQVTVLTHHLDRIGETARQALKEMRLLVHELRPAPLDHETLAEALRQRLEVVERRAGIEARLVTEGWTEVPAAMEDGLYRIAQEALNNALKHARAKTVTVYLRADGKHVALEVMDDGIGFEPSHMGQASGMGLASMRERAEKLGGELSIQSAPGQGTRVSVFISRTSRQ